MRYYIDFIITKKCNLNCKYCTSRASICSANCEYDFEQFKQDVDHLFSIGMDFTPVIIGGEPFCNTSILEYAKYLRSKDKKLPIAIFTNGKYLVHADDAFLDELSSTGASLWITVYNLSGIDYELIFNRCYAHKLKYRITAYNRNNVNLSDKAKILRHQMRMYKLCEKENVQDSTRLRKCMLYDTDNKPICIRVFNGIMYYGACLPMLTDIDAKFNTHFHDKLIEGEDYIYVKNIAKPEISVKSVQFCKKHCVYCGNETWSKSEGKREEFIYD